MKNVHTIFGILDPPLPNSLHFEYCLFSSVVILDPLNPMQIYLMEAP